MKNALLKAALDGIVAGTLTEPISTADLKYFISENNLSKPNGQPFADNSINCLLSNTSIKNIGAKGYDKVFKTFIAEDGTQFYFVASPHSWILQEMSVANPHHVNYFSNSANRPRLSR